MGREVRRVPSGWEHPKDASGTYTPLDCPPWTAEDATHFQLYETVTEGTPLSPVFATTAELVEHLVTHGDGWDRPVSRAAAEAFVRTGWVPSMVFVPGRGVVTGVEVAGLTHA
jgi:hypothetical protein